MKIVSPRQPRNQIQEISCVPNTPNTMANCIGGLVRRRDGDPSVVWIVDMSFCSVNKKNSKVASNKSERKRHCNAWKQGLGFILSLVQSLNNANIIELYNNVCKGITRSNKCHKQPKSLSIITPKMKLFVGYETTSKLPFPINLLSHPYKCHRHPKSSY